MSAQSDRRLRGGTIDDVLDVLPALVAELFPRPSSGAPVAAPPAGVVAAGPAEAAAPAPFIYVQTGPYAGTRLGTPCGGRF